MIFKVRTVSQTALFAVLLGVAVGCHKDGSSGPASVNTVACASNMKVIAEAKQAWVASAGKSPSDTPTWDDLAQFMRHGVPACPDGGKYEIGKVSDPPKCSIAAHNAYYQSHP
jgi:hypothetical protein